MEIIIAGVFVSGYFSNIVPNFLALTVSNVTSQPFIRHVWCSGIFLGVKFEHVCVGLIFSG
jgi:hypothetical protein